MIPKEGSTMGKLNWIAMTKSEKQAKERGKEIWEGRWTKSEKQAKNPIEIPSQYMNLEKGDGP